MLPMPPFEKILQHWTKHDETTQNSIIVAKTTLSKTQRTRKLGGSNMSVAYFQVNCYAIFLSVDAQILTFALLCQYHCIKNAVAKIIVLLMLE